MCSGNLLTKSVRSKTIQDTTRLTAFDMVYEKIHDEGRSKNVIHDRSRPLH